MGQKPGASSSESVCRQNGHSRTLIGWTDGLVCCYRMKLKAVFPGMVAAFSVFGLAYSTPQKIILAIVLLFTSITGINRFCQKRDLSERLLPASFITALIISGFFYRFTADYVVSLVLLFCIGQFVLSFMPDVSEERKIGVTGLAMVGALLLASALNFSGISELVSKLTQYLHSANCFTDARQCLWSRSFFAG